MLSRLSLLLTISLFALTTHAQDLNKQINTTKAQDIPAPVKKWISAELAKGKNKTLLNDYKSDRFFSTDSSRIIGYIKGYDSAQFTSGIIYLGNVVTREDHPTVVTIHPDGRFETTIKMMHPQWMSISFARKYWLPVYVEPGQAASMIFDWQELLKYKETPAAFNKTILYGGPTARINTEVNSIAQPIFDYKAFQEQVKTHTPDSFKTATLKSWNDAKEKLETQLAQNKYLEQTKTILRDQIDLDYGIWLLDFIMYREYEKKDTANKVAAVKESSTFYDFLSRVDYNRQHLSISKNYATFVNRVEFSPPFREASMTRRVKIPGESPVANLLYRWQVADTLLPNKYGIATSGFLYEICKARSTKNAFDLPLKNKKDEARIYLTKLENGISHPFLMKETEMLFHQKFSEGGNAYILPDSKSAAIFKNIINKHKGKMLFVDFWATSCGPCIGNIMQQLPLRNKYKNNPDFDFVFITSEDESPKSAYEKFIKEQSLVNTYRINPDDYLSLRELFKFNGIPRYVLIDKDGKVLDDDFEMYQFKEELPKLFPGKDWK